MIVIDVFSPPAPCIQPHTRYSTNEGGYSLSRWKSKFLFFVSLYFILWDVHEVKVRAYLDNSLFVFLIVQEYNILSSFSTNSATTSVEAFAETSAKQVSVIFFIPKMQICRRQAVYKCVFVQV